MIFEETIVKKKIIGKYKYEGLGFPIELTNVEFVMLSNEWHPKIDVRRIADTTIKKLAAQGTKLTGNQIKFIRGYFSMSLRQFAKKVVNESHMAVSKWEKFGNQPTHMDDNIEVMLRLYIYEKTSAKTAKQKNTFFEKYLALRDAFFAAA